MLRFYMQCFPAVNAPASLVERAVTSLSSLVRPPSMGLTRVAVECIFSEHLSMIPENRQRKNCSVAKSMQAKISDH